MWAWGWGSGSCGAPECQRTAETAGQRPYIKGWRSRPEKGNQGGGDPRVWNLSCAHCRVTPLGKGRSELHLREGVWTGLIPPARQSWRGGGCQLGRWGLQQRAGSWSRPLGLRSLNLHDRVKERAIVLQAIRPLTHTESSLCKTSAKCKLFLDFAGGKSVFHRGRIWGGGSQTHTKRVQDSLSRAEAEVFKVQIPEPPAESVILEFCAGPLHLHS